MSSTDSSATSRRSLLTAAAWSVPAIGLAVATPLAAASVGHPEVAFTHISASFKSFRDLSTGATIEAQALVSEPVRFTVGNEGVAFSRPVTVRMVVSRPSTPLTEGRARGFGLSAIQGVTLSGSDTSAVYALGPDGTYGFPVSTTTTTIPLTVPESGLVHVPITFGLSGGSTNPPLTGPTTFPVNVSLDFGGGITAQTSASIVVYEGAGIL